MNIIRKIKLNSLGMYEFNDSEKELYEFIKDNFLNLKQVILRDYPNYIFYFKDDKCIFQHTFKSNNFYVRYSFIWKVFEIKFNYNYHEISNLIKDIMKYAYKLNEIKPKIIGYVNWDKVEQFYKLNTINIH